MRYSERSAVVEPGVTELLLLEDRHPAPCGWSTVSRELFCALVHRLRWAVVWCSLKALREARGGVGEIATSIRGEGRGVDGERLDLAGANWLGVGVEDLEEDDRLRLALSDDGVDLAERVL